MGRDTCRPEQGATDYTIQASVVVLATGGAVAISGFVAERIGYVSHFHVSAMLCLLGVVAAAVVTRNGFGYDSLRYRSRAGEVNAS